MTFATRPALFHVKQRGGAVGGPTRANPGLSTPHRGSTTGLPARAPPGLNPNHQSLRPWVELSSLGLVPRVPARPYARCATAFTRRPPSVTILRAERAHRHQPS